MGFLSPWFLGGLFAVGLPIYIHLLQQHKTTPMPFSSLMFFERRTQSSIKHRRLKYLLLFALRLALILLLILAFAQPFINRPASAIAGERLLMLVVDDSFSMRMGDKLAEAKRQAQSQLAAKAANERAQVIALGGQLRLLTQPVPGEPELRGAIESIKPGDGRGNYADLARMLRSMAQNVRTPIEVHLYTDLQKTALPPNFTDLALPENVTLKLHPVGATASPNWAVERVNAPAQLWDTKTARIQATIAGYATPQSTRTVSLVVGGNTQATKTVQVPPNGRGTVEFTGLEVPYGFSKCEVRIDGADGLTLDDKAIFSVERSDPRKVLMVHEQRDSRSPLYIRAALGAATQSAFVIDALPTEQTANIQPSRFAFVVLSDVLSLPASFEEELKKYVRSGGSVLVALGPSAARANRRVPVFDEPVIEGKMFERSGERFQTIGDADPEHPSLKRALKWEGVQFFYVVKVNPGNSRVVAKLADQTPLLLDKKIGEGRVLVLTSTLDNISNDFPISGAFVPFIEQTSRYLAGMSDRNQIHPVGSFVELRSAREQSVSVEIVDPSGARPLSLKDSTTAQSFALTSEGFYELRRANGRHEMIAVNADRRESDLSVIPDETVALWKNTGSGSAAAQDQQAASGGKASVPYSLWWWFLLALLLVAVAESLFAGRYLGVSREADVNAS